MKQATTILATLVMGAFTAAAGTVAPAPVGKNPVIPPAADPCPGGISYSNIELLYVSTSDFIADGVDGDGVSLGLEYGLGSNFYLAAEAQYHEADFNSDLTTVSVGVGGYFALTQNIHLVGEVGAIWADVSLGQDSTDEIGWYATPHVRAKWGCLEAHAGVRFIQIDELGGRQFDFHEESYFVNVFYQVAPAWDITAGFSDSDERTTWSAGVRYKF